MSFKNGNSKQKTSHHHTGIKEIIDASAKKQLKDLSEQFGLPKSTVKTILSQQDTFLRAVNFENEAKRTRLQPVKHDVVEEAVLQWLRAARTEHIPVRKYS